MGKPRNTRKYPTYPEIPRVKKYPEIPDLIFRHSYPTRTQPATRYFVQYPTRYWKTLPAGHWTRYPVFLSIPDPTRFSFENHRVAVTRNIGYYPIFRVFPDTNVPKYHNFLIRFAWKSPILAARFMSGIFGYFRVFQVFVGISGYIWVYKYRVIPETPGLPEISGNTRYFGLPATRWFSKLNRVGSGIERNTGYRVQCPAGRVFQYRVGLGIGQNTG